MSHAGGNAGVLSERQVDIIATRLAERMSGAPAPSPAPAASPRAPVSTPREALGNGVFATVDDAVDAANAAFREFDGMTLEGRKQIIASIRDLMLEHAEELARLAHAETGLGRVEDKVVKNRLVTRKTSGTEVLTPHAVTGDHGHADDQPDVDDHLQHDCHGLGGQRRRIQRPPERARLFDD